MPPLSTNAPYLISVWSQIHLSPQPVTAIFKTMHYSPGGNTSREQKNQGRSSQKAVGAKVDIVAANGKRWIRINTIKNSRLMAELREIDSYMTDSSEDEANARPSLAQSILDNSILRMARDLVKAAQANPIELTSEIPSITIRLTRLDLNAEGRQNDPRMAQTVKMVRDMGIDVEFGEQEVDISLLPTNGKPSEDPLPPPPLKPTLSINLDLSILIALVSDLTHSPLPTDVKDAQARFIPPKSYRQWKKQRALASNKPRDPTEPNWDDDSESTPTDVGKHSRALTNQVLQEMGKGLIQDIHDRLVALSPNMSDVVFWTTPEARDRAVKIVAKIGGEMEKNRIRGMFPSGSPITPISPSLTLSEAEEVYWRDSRYPRNIIPLLPIRIFQSEIPTAPANLSRSPFFQSLDITCQYILEQEFMAHPNAFPEEAIDRTEIQRAMVTKVNPRLTAHTVQSMLWGARLAWTTLTANRASLKALMKEIRSVKQSGRLDNIKGDEDDIAAVWLCDPKSLGEQMRSDDFQLS